MRSYPYRLGIPHSKVLNAKTYAPRYRIAPPPHLRDDLGNVLLCTQSQALQGSMPPIVSLGSISGPLYGG